ncbi:sugar phosphate isomerase/epimerase [Murinocardiopsis flavida]|uniref:Sugar phosphate isomerase/epimerase n=1 Tax=Murinocardiopsis flavida TaxID=645275 RepID=A0A2P8DLX5_9ACTN|nr:sugar phosphate isomerase/epimerase [Murinocardiopsis flavida]PSK98214.1 sugar phosphate isomerase/epimerase [Murinocardiopsis flavida]
MPRTSGPGPENNGGTDAAGEHTGAARRGFFRIAAGTAALTGLTATALTVQVGTAAAEPAATRKPGKRRGIPTESISVQMYTLREAAAADLEGTLAGLADIGYTKIETAGFYGRSAAEFKSLLDKHGLKATSGHHGIPQPFDADAWATQLKDANTLGYTYINVPSGPNGSTEKHWRDFAADLTTAGRQAAKAGLKFGYHNHHYEFARLADADKRAYDVLIERTDPRYVHFELDLFWSWRGAQDPTPLITDNRNHRFPQFHVKDMNLDGQFEDVGLGLIDFRPTFAAALPAKRVEFIVEHDSAGADALDHVRRSFEHLSALEY